MDEVRLIDGNALEQEMREFAAQIFVGCHRTTTDSEEAVHTCADMVNEAQTIDPESLRPVSEWELNPDKWTCEWFRCKKCHHTSCCTDAFCGGCGAKMKNRDVEIDD